MNIHKSIKNLLSIEESIKSKILSKKIPQIIAVSKTFPLADIFACPKNGSDVVKKTIPGPKLRYELITMNKNVHITPKVIKGLLITAFSTFTYKPKAPVKAETSNSCSEPKLL